MVRSIIITNTETKEIKSSSIGAVAQSFSTDTKTIGKQTKRL